MLDRHIAISLVPALLLVMLFSSSPLQAAGQSLGINLAGLHDWNSELPFVDVFRLSRTWVSQEEGKPWGKGPPLVVDEKGWITRLAPGAWAEACILNIRGARYPRGTYTLLFDGKGKIDIGNVWGKPERSPGRVRFTTTGRENIIWIRIRETDPEDYVRNIRVYMPGYGQSPPGDILRPGFLERWQGMEVVRFMEFLDVNNSREERWSDRVQLDDATWTVHGGPIEAAIEISNRLQASPWFSIPHRADDEYVYRFAQLVKKQLDPNLKVYLEYSNETWNSLFEQNAYCRQRGQAMGLSRDPHQAGLRFAALRSLQIFRIWEEVFGGRSRLVRVMAGQAANPSVAKEKLQYRSAWKQCDALAVAPYITLNVSPHSTPPQQEVRRWSLAHLQAQLKGPLFSKAVHWMKQSQEVADAFGLPLIAYEGGQHLVGMVGAENDEQLTELFLAANRAPEMGDLYGRYLDRWQEITGNGLFCLWLSVEVWNKWGAWGLLEFFDQSEEDSPKFKAVRRRMGSAETMRSGNP